MNESIGEDVAFSAPSLVSTQFIYPGKCVGLNRLSRHSVAVTNAPEPSTHINGSKTY